MVVAFGMGRIDKWKQKPDKAGPSRCHFVRAVDRSIACNYNPYNHKYFVSCVTAHAAGKSLQVKPAKVVAGHEPEKTNEFLQALAAAISSKVNSW